MMTMIEMLLVFVAMLILSIGMGLLAVPTASVFKRILPRSRLTCSRCIDGWMTKRGLKIRLLLTPLCLTLALYVAVTVLDNYTVRRNITESDRLIVRSGGICHRKPDREQVLLETVDKKVIKNLANQITLAFGIAGMQCRCCGDITFELYQGQQPRCIFTLHHGRSIRIKDFSRNDKDLSPGSRMRLTKWLDQTGITSALARERKEEALRDRNELQEEVNEVVTPGAVPNAQ